MRMRRRRKGRFLYIRATIIATGSYLLYTKYEFYGFNNDLRDRITLQNHCHKAGFCKNKYRLYCYVLRLMPVVLFEYMHANCTFLVHDSLLLI